MTAVAMIESPVAAPPPNAVQSMLRTYRRRLPLFLGVFLGLIALTCAWVFAQTPRYTAETAIVVAPRKAEVGSDRSAPLSDPTTDASVDTQVEVLRSRQLADAVVARLGLDREPAFSRLTHTPTWRERLGFARPDGEAQRRGSRHEQAVDALSRGLDVHRVAQTFVLDLGFTSPDRRMSADVANAYAEAYVRQSLDLKLLAARSGNGPLRAQLTQAQAELTAANTALGRYRVRHDLMSVGGATLAEQQLTNLDQQVALARSRQAEADARLSTARTQMARGSNGEDVGEALSSPVIQDLRKQRADVSRRIAELSERYEPAYPAIGEARRQLGDVDAQIQGEVGRIVSSLKAQESAAAEGTASLQASADRARGAVAGNNVASVGLADLQIRAEAAQTLYQQLLDRVREIGTQAATVQPDARIASAAVPPPRPSAPNVPIDILVGTLVAFAAAVGAVVLRQQLDEGLSTLDEVEGKLHLPYLAGLPTLRSSIGPGRASSPVAAVISHAHSAYAEGFRTLGVSILAGRDAPVRSIMLTSALPDEGKTTATICLARTLASDGKSVIVVDADLRRPGVAGALGLKPRVGLREVIVGEAELDEALVLDAVSGAAILPLLRGSRFWPALMDDPRFDRLIERLHDRFDVILFDSCPILPVVEGRLLAAKADAVVLLARWRKTPEAAVEMAIQMLRRAGASTVGIALSRVDLQSLARSGYGDPARFLRDYNSYYYS